MEGIQCSKIVFLQEFIGKTSYSLGFGLKKEMKILYDKTIHIISQSTLKNKNRIT